MGQFMSTNSIAPIMVIGNINSSKARLGFGHKAALKLLQAIYDLIISMP